MSHAWLNLYSNGDNQGWQKPDNLPQRFGLIHNDKQIENCLVFKYYHLNFASYFVLMQLNTIYCFVLSMRIKYDDSKNRNNCVMRKSSIVVLIPSKIYVTSELFIWSDKKCEGWVVLCSLPDSTLFIGYFYVNCIIQK